MKLKSGGKEKEPYDSTHMRDIKWRATNGPSERIHGHRQQDGGCQRMGDEDEEDKEDDEWRLDTRC